MTDVLGTLSAATQSSRWPALHPTQGEMPSVAIVSTFPPTQCGLATFAAALSDALGRIGVQRIGVIDVVDGQDVAVDPRVVGALTPLSASRVAAARAINSHDMMLLQHEFGIFSGDDGIDVLGLLADVHVPVVVTLHTVPLEPSRGQRAILEQLGSRCDALVTMTHEARDRFVRLYHVNADKVSVIPHGATVPDFAPLPASGPIELLTWGLLGPGKGIEWVVDALAMAPELRGHVRYTVAGQTHPKVLKANGEAYRDMLKRRVEFLGISDMVTFDNSYREVPSLIRLIQGSHCVVLPYDSLDQITSGVLVDALVAARPVIATRFPHAVELLSRGVGLTVPHADPVAMAGAIRMVVNQPQMLSAMSNATFPIAGEHRWTTVAAQYMAIGARAAHDAARGGHGDL